MAIHDDIPPPPPMGVDATIKDSAAGSAIFEKEKITSGRCYSRLHFAGLDYSRFGVNVLNKFEQLVMPSHKYVSLQVEGRKDPVVVNVDSLCKRLLLSKEDVLKAKKEGTLEALVQTQAYTLAQGQVVLNQFEMAADKSIVHKQTGEKTTFDRETLIKAAKEFGDFQKETTKESGFKHIKVGEKHQFFAIKTKGEFALVNAEEKLGAGTFGAVRKVYNVMQGTRDAFKKNKLSSDVSGAKQEYETLRDIHKNGVLEGIQAPPHMLMDHEGSVGFLGKLYHGDVDKWMKNRNHTPTERLSVCNKLMTGFSNFVTADYWHKDIKPANMLMSQEGGPVLADMGSAVRVSPKTPAAAKDFDMVEIPNAAFPEDKGFTYLSGVSPAYVDANANAKQLQHAKKGAGYLKDIEALKKLEQEITDLKEKRTTERDNIKQIILDEQIDDKEHEFALLKNEKGSIEQLQAKANEARDKIHKIGQYQDFYAFSKSLDQISACTDEETDKLTYEDNQKYNAQRRIIAEMGMVTLDEFDPKTTFQEFRKRFKENADKPFVV